MRSQLQLLPRGQKGEAESAQFACQPFRIRRQRARYTDLVHDNHDHCPFSTSGKDSLTPSRPCDYADTASPGTPAGQHRRPRIGITTVSA
jgi:hypothetical protein